MRIKILRERTGHVAKKILKSVALILPMLAWASNKFLYLARQYVIFRG